MEDSKYKFTNQLVNERSTYLQQHAHNPVDWRPWNQETLELAAAHNKPIILSIGYSTCHWCHVMEKESFEDEVVAQFMNQHFINIKVDREERPDLDHYYMDACQLINGQGGWPLNCFLLPDGSPFFVGTYFAPFRTHNRPTWLELLQNIHNIYQQNFKELEQQAQKITASLSNRSTRKIKQNAEIEQTHVNFESIFNYLGLQNDRINGGFGTAPKFPSTHALQAYLSYNYFFDKNDFLNHVNFTLDEMGKGGIYDHIGGGFSRYTVDNAWKIPHFEKMLYDNALLISLYSDTFKISKNEYYKSIVEESIAFVMRELKHHDGGFFSAIDADSENEEGKFYTWKKEEVATLLDNDLLDIFCDFYNISTSGNWEHTNILYKNNYYKEYSERKQLDFNYVKKSISFAKQILFQHRSQRIAPIRDNKILLDWNSLMIIAFVDAYQAFGNELYKEIAIENTNWLLNNFIDQNDNLFHCWIEREKSIPAFLDDYAFFIKCLLKVHFITQDEKYFAKAQQLNQFVVENFLNDEQDGFYFTSKSQGEHQRRAIYIYDTSTPSGNSVMFGNLLIIQAITYDTKLAKLCDNFYRAYHKMAEAQPLSMANWIVNLMLFENGIAEIKLSGKNKKEAAWYLLSKFIPNMCLNISETTDNDNDEELEFQICKNNTCFPPVDNLTECLALLK